MPKFPSVKPRARAEKCGGAKARDRRLEVLERLASLGNGLTTAQKNDWAWWKEAWDERMMGEHGDDWPWVFSSWVQKTLDDVEAGDGAAVSAFVYAETARCFSGEPAISMPGAG